VLYPNGASEAANDSLTRKPEPTGLFSCSLIRFLEATVYSKETSVIMVCEFADADTPEKRAKINGVNYFWSVRQSG
jgi:hypothetical protein